MTPIARRYFLVIGAMFLGLVAHAAQAAIVVQGTRVVFPEKSREVTVKINNTSADPVLVQSWVDDGQANVAPEELKVPFVVAPAVSRVDPQSAAVLRISALRPNLPKDRESLFWLNVLETPPRSPTDETVLQFTFRTRIKLFFRPASLPSHADQAGEKLIWKRVRHAKGQTPSIEVSNPTPYYVSFGQVDVRVGHAPVSADVGMVAPFAKTLFTLAGPLPQGTKTFVQYEVINDFGGRQVIEKPLPE